MRILVVEDNPLISQAIERAGGQSRLTTDTATDGWDAIQKLESEAYDAIVIDADLPRHSGFGVLTYLREEVGDELDNVIVMTSSDRDEVRRKLTGRVEVIGKSDEAELQRAVRAICAVASE